jgi:hypothetical protein
MKKISILIFILFCIVNVNAQTKTDNKQKYVYCQLLMQPRAFSTKVNITVDYGQETNFFQDTRLRDEESGKLKKFNSIVDALNYMAEQGWEYIDSYNLQSNSGTATIAPTSLTHWVLRKTVL